jgi:uncharacterized protein YceK
MKKALFLLASLTTLSALSGCASIISGSHPVSIQSTPSMLSFRILDENGSVVHTGTTPTLVTLDASDEFFSKAHYKIEVSNEANEIVTRELTPSIDGWYWGNILAGGVIGMLIVDPATGAMYSLPKAVSVDAMPKKSASVPSLQIQSTNNLTPEQKSQMKPLGK